MMARGPPILAPLEVYSNSVCHRWNPGRPDPGAPPSWPEGPSRLPGRSAEAHGLVLPKGLEGPPGSFAEQKPGSGRNNLWISPSCRSREDAEHRKDGTVTQRQPFSARPGWAEPPFSADLDTCRARLPLIHEHSAPAQVSPRRACPVTPVWSPGAALRADGAQGQDFQCLCVSIGAQIRGPRICDKSVERF